MKAWVVPSKDQLGLEKLTCCEMPKPQPGSDEMLIAVRAVGINPADYKLAELGDAGWKYPHVLGLDLAGVVEEAGCEIKGFKAGDRVCAHINLSKQGCFADYALAPEYCAAHIPENVSFEEAAGMLSTGITAYQVLCRKVNLANRKTALIHAGSGGVGSMAVQMAKNAGMTVYTTVPTNAIDYVKELGADVAIDFMKEDFTEIIPKLTDGFGVDFILDPLNQAHVDQNIDLLAFNGDIVCLTTPPSNESVGKLFFKGLGLHLVFTGAAHQSGNVQQQKDLGCMAAEVLKMISEGKLKVHISKTFPFAEMAQALTELKTNPPLGKFVIVNE